MEPVAVDQPPVAQWKNLHSRPLALRGDADHVYSPYGSLVRRLPLGEMPHGEQTVPVARRLLETLAFRGVLHLPLELAQDRARLPREELDHAVDDLAVPLFRDVADA